MGVARALEYRVRPQNFAQRAVNRIAGTWPMPRLIAPVLPRLDALVSSVTGGRASVTGVAGQEPLWVEIHSSRVGGSRTVPLLAFPFGEDLAVIASNFGRPDLPSWAAALRRHPEVELRMGERSTAATTREATEGEAEKVWEAATRILPAYAGYRKRVTQRAMPVFVFEPRPRPGAA